MAAQTHADLSVIAQDGDLPDNVPLPCDSPQHWHKILRAFQQDQHIRDVHALQAAMMKYELGGPDLFNAPPHLKGLDAVRSIYQQEFPDLMDNFYSFTLPYIIRQMKKLPELIKMLPGGKLPFLKQGVKRQLVLDRSLVVSLMANVFLCTFDKGFLDCWQTNTLNLASFKRLFARDASVPQEIAKLAMFIHFFNRLEKAEREQRPEFKGKVIIDRVVGVSLTGQEWLASRRRLRKLEVVDKGQGFEDLTDPTLGSTIAHADFANMYIGGGVFWGGCVQEEIRFAVCPDLCVAVIVCPVMQPEEAIQIIGAERFSSYSGYAFKLKFAGDYVDRQPREPDGTLHSCILAMDAQDFRGRDASFTAQLSPPCLLRDLNKSFAAFTPGDNIVQGQWFPSVATGNWGCGAFNGNPQLNSLVQWATSSQADRQLRFYPFSEEFGPELQLLSDTLCDQEATVGDLLCVVDALQSSMRPTEIFNIVKQAVIRRCQGCQAPPPKPGMPEPASEAIPDMPDWKASAMRRTRPPQQPPAAGARLSRM